MCVCVVSADRVSSGGCECASGFRRQEGENGSFYCDRQWLYEIGAGVGAGGLALLLALAALLAVIWHRRAVSERRRLRIELELRVKRQLAIRIAAAGGDGDIVALALRAALEVFPTATAAAAAEFTDGDPNRIAHLRAAGRSATVTMALEDALRDVQQQQLSGAAAAAAPSPSIGGAPSGRSRGSHDLAGGSSGAAGIAAALAASAARLVGGGKRASASPSNSFSGGRTTTPATAAHLPPLSEKTSIQAVCAAASPGETALVDSRDFERGLAEFADFQLAKERGVGSAVAITLPLTAGDLVSGFLTVHFSADPTEDEDAAIHAREPAEPQHGGGWAGRAGTLFFMRESNAISAAGAAAARRASVVIPGGISSIRRAAGSSRRDSEQGLERGGGPHQHPQQQRDSAAAAGRRSSVTDAKARTLMEDICEAVGGALWVRRALMSYGAAEDRALSRVASVARSTHNTGNLLRRNAAAAGGNQQQQQRGQAERIEQFSLLQGGGSDEGGGEGDGGSDAPGPGGAYFVRGGSLDAGPSLGGAASGTRSRKVTGNLRDGFISVGSILVRGKPGSLSSGLLSGVGVAGSPLAGVGSPDPSLAALPLLRQLSDGAWLLSLLSSFRSLCCSGVPPHISRCMLLASIFFPHTTESFSLFLSPPSRCAVPPLPDPDPAADEAEFLRLDSGAEDARRRMISCVSSPPKSLSAMHRSLAACPWLQMCPVQGGKPPYLA